MVVFPQLSASVELWHIRLSVWHRAALYLPLQQPGCEGSQQGPAGLLACVWKLLKAFTASSHFPVPPEPAPWGPLGSKDLGVCSDLLLFPFSSKPRLLLLPVLCQRNLFSLLLMVQAVVPAVCLSQLLQAVEQDSHLDPWVRTLKNLLRQGPRGGECSPPAAPLSSACQQQLKWLCQKITQNKSEGQRKLRWCFSKEPSAAGVGADSMPQGGQCKKVSEESLELNEREEKRLLVEEAAFEPLGAQEAADVAGMEEEIPEDPSGDGSAQDLDESVPESSQQEVAKEPTKTSEAQLAVEVQSFLQVLGRVCFILPASEPHTASFLFLHLIFLRHMDKG